MISIRQLIAGIVACSMGCAVVAQASDGSANSTSWCGDAKGPWYSETLTTYVPSVSSPPVVRFATNTQEGKRQLAQLKRVVFTMKARDAEALRDGKPVPLTGYDAIRSVHGYGDEPGIAQEKQLSARLPTFPEGFNIWCRCQHAWQWRAPDAPLFLLWHRAYLKAFEITGRSILKLLDDPDWASFAVPYWDWTNFPSVPEEFLPDPKRRPNACMADKQDEQDNPLVDRFRSNVAQEGRPVWREDQYVSPFQGNHGDFVKFSSELFTTWHNAIHNSFGVSSTDLRDMGDPAYAVRDPLFWVHHSNIDRLLIVWNKRQGSRANYNDEELSKAWDGQFKFPVETEQGLAWFSPTYSELQMHAPVSALGYRYARNLGYPEITPIKPATLPIKRTLALLKYRQVGASVRLKSDDGTYALEIESSRVTGGASVADDSALGHPPFYIGEDGIAISLDINKTYLEELAAQQKHLEHLVLKSSARQILLSVESPQSSSDPPRWADASHAYQVFIYLDDLAQGTRTPFWSHYIGTLSTFGFDGMDLVFDVTPQVLSLLHSAKSGVVQKKLLAHLKKDPDTFSRIRLIFIPGGQADTAELKKDPKTAFTIKAMSIRLRPAVTMPMSDHGHH